MIKHTLSCDVKIHCQVIFLPCFYTQCTLIPFCFFFGGNCQGAIALRIMHSEDCMEKTESVQL